MPTATDCMRGDPFATSTAPRRPSHLRAVSQLCARPAKALRCTLDTAPGAAGGIGQPLALLLKMNPLVGALSLYDVVATPGVGADLGHINTGAPVRALSCTSSLL